MDIRHMVERKNQPQSALLGRGGKMGTNLKFTGLNKLIERATTFRQQGETALSQLHIETVDDALLLVNRSEGK